MNTKRRGVSLGTILALCLTAVVAVGYFVLYLSIRSRQAPSGTQSAPVAGLMADSEQEETPDPQSTVKTVTVTMPPAVTAVPAPAETVPANMHYDAYSFDLTLGGMVAYQSDISDALYNKTQKTLDYSPVLSLIAPKIHADLNIVTFGQVINSQDLKYADVQVPSCAADALRAAGFDDVMLCTEHVLDQGVQGAASTVQVLTAKGLSCGGVTAGDTHQHRMIQLNGAKIALLAYTDVLTAKGKNAQESQPNALRLYDEQAARRDIQAAKAQGASLVIVYMYWGRADTASVTNAQRGTARALAEMGADVIVGNRPTRVLPMELITTMGDDGRARQTFVAYSMGSLVTESREAYDISGTLLHLRIVGDEQGHVRFAAVEYTPTYIWKQTVDGKMQYRVVCSADPAPAGMDEKQRQYMANALNRVQKTLHESPVSLRQSYER